MDHIRPLQAQLLHSSTAKAHMQLGRPKWSSRQQSHMMLACSVAHSSLGWQPTAEASSPTAMQFAQVPGQLPRQETPSTVLLCVHQTLAVRAHQGAE